MDIVIPTCGRWKSQPTHEQLEAARIPHMLVVQFLEFKHYAKYESPTTRILILPDHINTIAPTRDWIVQNAGTHTKLLMLDDDLTFYRRRMDDPTKLRDLELGDMERLIEDIQSELEWHPHVGIAAREGANRCTDSTIHNTRIMRVLGYRRDILMRECIAFDRMEVMEDFDVALRLLRLGMRNCILNWWANNQAGSGVSGGCSGFRTRELQAINAEKLARFHPGFVKVVKKETKGSFGGGVRTDVLIQWKKAYQAGCAK